LVAAHYIQVPDMKLSMMTYTVTRSPAFDLLKMLNLTKELNMAGIDICFPEKLGKPINELNNILQDYAIPVVCSTFANNINAPDMTEEKWMDNLKTGLEDAASLGSPAIMIPTPGAPEIDRNSNRNRWLNVLSKGVQQARKYGIHLTIENFPGDASPFVVADDMLEAARQVPELKLTYDNGNAASGEEPAESFRRCAQHVIHAHFKDWDIVDQPTEGFRRFLDGRYYRAALIGEGEIDHKACLRAMSECGYEGCINIEYEGAKYDPYEAVRKAVEYLQAIEASITNTGDSTGG